MPHFPTLPTFPHHKHEGNESNVVSASPPDPQVLQPTCQMKLSLHSFMAPCRTDQC
jgi:hypothetical protein